MNAKSVAGLVCAGLVLAANAAWADSGKHWKRGHRDSGRDYEYARVVDVDPIIQRVRVSVPREQCYEETRYDGGHSSAPRGSAGSMILGSLIGAAVGNQIGSGDGRRAATVAGAVIGTAIGHDVADRRNATRTTSSSRTVERCETTYVDDYEERVDGYDVTYVYNGRRMTTRMPYDPGDRVRVRVDVYPDSRY